MLLSLCWDTINYYKVFKKRLFCNAKKMHFYQRSITFPKNFIRLCRNSILALFSILVNILYKKEGMGGVLLFFAFVIFLDAIFLLFFLKNIKNVAWKTWYFFQFILQYYVAKSEKCFFHAQKRQKGWARSFLRYFFISPKFNLLKIKLGGNKHYG